MENQLTKHIWSHWFEIPVSDMKRAQDFYRAVFQLDYEFMDLGELQMSVFAHGDVGMALCKHPQFYQPGSQGPLVYLNANPDLQVFLDRIKTQGGQVIQQKKQISPEHGYMALFIDSEGNRLALHSDQ